MSIHRAVRALLASLIVMGACTVSWLGAPALAQGTIVQLILVSQTAITTHDEPLLTMTVQATNAGETTIDDLSLGISIGEKISSRFVYEQSLVEGPGTAIFVTTEPQAESLEPGQQRLIDVELNMLEQVPEITNELDSAVYPAQIDIRADGVVQAALNTPLIHLVRTPDRPMRLSWWTEITGPIAFDPEGRLERPLDRGIGRARRHPGRPGRRAPTPRRRPRPTRPDGHLRANPPSWTSSDAWPVAMSGPTARSVEEDQRPATDAATVLEILSGVAADPDVQIAAMPFAAPLMPAMLAGGLSGDLDEQRALGDETVEELLGRQPVTSFERPPSGAIDDATLDDLAIRGVGAVLANADAVDRTAQLNDFSPLPVASFTLPSGSSLDMVLPDPEVQALLADPVLLGDPVRGAQAVLGELATIWREQPVPAEQPDGTETVRGVAVALAASLPPGMWGPMTRRLADAPFLVPTHAQDFVETVNPVQPADVLATPSPARFDRDVRRADPRRTPGRRGLSFDAPRRIRRSPTRSAVICCTPKPATTWTMWTT